MKKRALFLLIIVSFSPLIFADEVDQFAFGLKKIYEEQIKIEEQKQKKMRLGVELEKTEHENLKTVWNTPENKEYKDTYEKNYSEKFEKIDRAKFDVFFKELLKALKTDAKEFKKNDIQKIFTNLKERPWIYFGVKDYITHQLDKNNSLQKKFKDLLESEKTEPLILSLNKLLNKSDKDQGIEIINNLKKYLEYLIGEKQYDVNVMKYFNLALKEDPQKALDQMKLIDTYIQNSSVQKGLLDKELDKKENERYKDLWAEYIFSNDIKLPYYEHYKSEIESNEEYFKKFFDDFKKAFDNNTAKDLINRLEKNIGYYIGNDTYIIHALEKDNQIDFKNFLQSNDGKPLFESLQKLIDGKTYTFKDILEQLKEKHNGLSVIAYILQTEDAKKSKNIAIRRNAIIDAIIKSTNIKILKTALNDDKDLYLTPLDIIGNIKLKDSDKITKAFLQLNNDLDEEKIKPLAKFLITQMGNNLRNLFGTDITFIDNLTNTVLDNFNTAIENNNDKNKNQKINDFIDKMSKEFLRKNFKNNWPYTTS